MRPLSPRRPWTWTCAGCLAALAGAIFWPASDIPRLAPAADASPLDSVAASAVPAARDDDDAALQPQAIPAEPDEPAPRVPDMRDAVADGPRRLAEMRGDWAQAPWQAYWGVTPRETAAVPVPQALPRVYRRASAGRPRAMPRIPAKRAPPQAGPRPDPAATPPEREPPMPEAAPTPKRALSRMRELLRRIMAYRSPHAGPLVKKTASAWDSRGRPKTVAGREDRPGPGEASRSEAKRTRRPRWRPVLLSRALGARSIRPPALKGQAPDLRRLARLFPKTGPDGKPLRWSPASAAALENLRPPEAEAVKCRRSARHWHPGPPAFHAGGAWAVGRPEGWAWLQKSGKRWWAWTGADQPTWLWHQERWWWRSQGIWFMLHQGEAWGYRVFGERRSEGLIHPGTGTRMEYSADGERAALITPGDGAWLFDARSGAVLHRWTEAQMPRRPKPRAPSALSFPR